MGLAWLNASYFRHLASEPGSGKLMSLSVSLSPSKNVYTKSLPPLMFVHTVQNQILGWI